MSFVQMKQTSLLLKSQLITWNLAPVDLNHIWHQKKKLHRDLLALQFEYMGQHGSQVTTRGMSELSTQYCEIFTEQIRRTLLRRPEMKKKVESFTPNMLCGALYV